jgi:hypothetical protein
VLSRSSEDEGQAEEKKTRMEEKYKRFEESSRWIREQLFLLSGMVPRQRPRPALPKTRRTDEMLRILDLLDESADAIGTKLEQIEIRMGELQGEEEAGKKVLASIAPAKIQSRFRQGSGTRYRCKLGRMILMMGTFSIFVPADGTEVNEKRLVYEGIQGLQENVAMGIEEKQAEMREINKSQEDGADRAGENHSKKTAGLDIKGDRRRYAQTG